jgi:hypothetical protein
MKISRKRATGAGAIGVLLAALLTFGTPVGPAAAAWEIGNPDPPAGGFGYSGGKGVWCVWAPGKGVTCYKV